jgi:hypothetical protein
VWIHVPSEYCPYSQESQDWTKESDWRFRILEQSATLKGKHTASRYWLNACKKKSYLKRLCGQMLPPFEANLGVERFIASLGDSLVPTSLMPEKAQELTGNSRDSGENTTESFAKYDPNGCSWRTSQLSLEGELTEFLGTWPKQGTMQSGAVSVRKKLEHHTSGRDYSYWPTPRTQITRNTKTDRGKCNLEEMILTWDALVSHARTVQALSPVRTEQKELWPTPNASPVANNMELNCSGDGREKPNKLGWAVAQWATPTSLPACQEDSSQEYSPAIPCPSNLAKSELGYSHQDQAKETDGNKLSGNIPNSYPQLNPMFVTWLMGFPLGWVDIKHPLEKNNYEVWVMQSCLLLRQLLSERCLLDLDNEVQMLHMESE